MSRVGSEERGFVLSELLVAVMILATGIVALVSIFDSGEELVSQSELKEAATHRGQREIEKIQSLGYDRLAMSTDPGSGSGADDPRTRVFVSGGEKRFRYDRKDDSKSEPLVVAGTGEVTAGPTTFNDGRFSGRVWRFVTSVDDEACKLLNLVNVCATNKNYKRVTVVVEMSGLHNNLKPIWVSSIVSNPEDGPVGSASGPVTECLNSNGDLVQCVNSVEDKVNALFPTDTPATSSNTRQPITASHATHPTVATVTGLECTASTTTGCPKPDLLEDVPPQVTTPLPQLFKYSTDVAGGYPGGRALRRDASCSSTPTTSDNTKGAFWATPALSAPKTLNGKGGLSLYSQTIDGVTAGATVCVAFYDVPGSIVNLIAEPPTELGRTSFSLGRWPDSPTRVAFPFTFRASNVTVPQGHRIGIRVWVSSASGADLAVIYDHASYPTMVELNEPGEES